MVLVAALPAGIVFLPALFLMMGQSVEQVRVRSFPRVAGVSKYNLLNRLALPFLTPFITYENKRG